MEVDCETLQRRLAAGEDLVLLDCREQDEVQKVALAGSVWIPMSQLAQRQGELEPYRQRPIVVYCHLGGRSLQVAQWLSQQGFAEVASLVGGIDRWAETIDPGLPRY